MGAGGGLYPGGLIKGCLFLCVPGKWACNGGGGDGGSLLYLQLEILTIPFTDSAILHRINN